MLDFSYANSATLVLREHSAVRFILVGCGGTGGYLAQHLGRLMSVMQESGLKVSAIFADPDIVEEKNIGRQLFCPAEIGRNKAEALALRYGAAWGLDITAAPKRYEADGGVFVERGELVMLLGCVDNAAGRRSLAESLKANPDDKLPHVWWLDCGNTEETGQVLLGAANAEQSANHFPQPKICVNIPAPHVQAPDLLEARPDEFTNNKLSCAEIQMLNAQGLAINARLAAEAADFLVRMFITKNLRRYAVELNLAAGVAMSRYLLPEKTEL